MTPEIARLCKQYCGAVAVSWYRSEYTIRAIQMLLDAGVKTNIHYVLGKNSIDEALERLKHNDFPKGINAVIFLLHKPTGQGTRNNMLLPEDPKVAEFFGQIDTRHPFKVGMDSCNVPGAINFCKHIMPESLDTCEGGRYSCYIGADMIMVPCSFDQQKRYEVSLRNADITEAWNSEQFEKFRNHMRGACPSCDKKGLCMGGCPLMPEIVFCNSAERTIV
jgi:radical SAM protein with 4Fe4S-binding SPASM domain